MERWILGCLVVVLLAIIGMVVGVGILDWILGQMEG